MNQRNYALRSGEARNLSFMRKVILLVRKKSTNECKEKGRKKGNLSALFGLEETKGVTRGENFGRMCRGEEETGEEMCLEEE